MHPGWGGPAFAARLGEERGEGAYYYYSLSVLLLYSLVVFIFILLLLLLLLLSCLFLAPSRHVTSRHDVWSGRLCRYSIYTGCGS